ncbi:1,4-alpha-glucan branching enzyme [Salinibacter ruber]|uniref:glycogen-binding domain-containing protein n=1 Tax=Salinibacter ruber TaxID=146919 RepID=UPI00031396DF|nr:glycogen-binding domain-containing protein [Salinibacter ruber]MCS3668950.1 1,4-alpha-glucan branching enzyme [Salinibacter ruber]
MQIQVPYDGPGVPHVTGDFNGWSLPGTSLTQTDDGTWTTTLSVPSGEYAYRVRIVDGDERRWLSLPSYADTADDAFGGTNGVCTVP